MRPLPNGQLFYKPILVTEDKTVKIYYEDDSLSIYVPFVSLFCTIPGLVEYYKSANPSMFERIGDFGRISLQEDDEDLPVDIMTDQWLFKTRRVR